MLCGIVVAAVFATAIPATELPPGLSRFNPAGLSHGWEYEGTAFNAYRSAQGDSTVAILRMYHPTLGYLLAASEVEAANAAKAGYIREGTAFFAPTKGGIPVWRFHSVSAGATFYTVSREEGMKGGLAFDGEAFRALASSNGPDVVPVSRYREGSSGHHLFTASTESPYQVGAFYFGSFSASAKEIISGTKRIYGRENDWWGGVEDFYGREPGIALNHRNWPGEWPDLKPAIGFYDQTAVETLEQHINEAADAGLGFFSFYWYWSNAKKGELLPEALASMLNARNLQRIHFNLTLYAHPWADDMAVQPSNTEEVVGKLVAYFSHPQYLRLPDGRPVFSVGDDRNVRVVDGDKCADADCNERALAAFLNVLRKRTQEKLGVLPFVQVQVGLPAWDRQEAVDGITCLVPPFTIAGGTTYPIFTRDVFKAFFGPHKPVSPCMLENFDERPRQDVLITDRNAIRYLTGKTDDLFRHNLTVAKDAADSDFLISHSDASHLVYLYAWNEWHEGGIIEPNSHSGAHDLNIVTDVFQLPRAPSRCLEHGDCKFK